MTWDVPLADRCPQCGKTLFKRRGGVIVCLNEGCGYEHQLEKKAAKGKKASKSSKSKEAEAAVETPAGEEGQE